MRAERHVPPSSGPFVACVDDDLRVRESISNLLESAGIACQTFASAEDLLASGAEASAACLLLDVRMHGMSGLELQRAVRRRRPHIPVIFISAHQDDSVRSIAVAEGGMAFLNKPFDIDVLLKAVRRALKGHEP